ncbi:hypothetical protein BJ138DRAFT_1103236 [Hygrophoropsis aurantiaca]|uniref:Uncharacterized protein n=1 Tax=Hygrophoropsis aurantiaca TaxID=72124 RepID=A0ACB8A687_9AGAM|nr:hypothetical protein BJ138DRAFT_1103236 [Hygrophoropsis aurantiaca]
MTSGLYSHLLPPTCIAIVPVHSVPVPPPSLTLKECKINVCIIDAHSRVMLSQRFQNQSDLEANQVTYTFSMLATAADGTKIVGIVKEKEQARRELETALAAGHTAALGEEQTKDIFSICIGNVLPQETITINLSYINTLIDDESPNQIRFTLPRRRKVPDTHVKLRPMLLLRPTHSSRNRHYECQTAYKEVVNAQNKDDVAETEKTINFKDQTEIDARESLSYTEEA